MTQATTRVPAFPCLNCGAKLNAVGLPTGEEIPPPRPGDATVCGYCGHLMVFTDDITLRAPTHAELLELGGDPDVLLAQKFAAAAFRGPTSKKPSRSRRRRS